MSELFRGIIDRKIRNGEVIMLYSHEDNKLIGMMHADCEDLIDEMRYETIEEVSDEEEREVKPIYESEWDRKYREANISKHYFACECDRCSEFRSWCFIEIEKEKKLLKTLQKKRERNRKRSYRNSTQRQYRKIYYTERKNNDVFGDPIEKHLLTRDLVSDASIENVLDEAFSKLKISQDGDVNCELSFEHVDELWLDYEDKNIDYTEIVNKVERYEVIACYKENLKLMDRVNREIDMRVARQVNHSLLCRCRKCYEWFQIFTCKCDDCKEKVDPKPVHCGHTYCVNHCISTDGIKMGIMHVVMQHDRRVRLEKKRQSRLRNQKKRVKQTQKRKNEDYVYKK